MRRSFDGLSAVVEQRLRQDPRGGGLFVFANKRNNRLKVLWFDHNGYCMLYKRLHRALFVMPKAGDTATLDLRINAVMLGELIRGVDKVNVRGERKKLQKSAGDV